MEGGAPEPLNPDLTTQERKTKKERHAVRNNDQAIAKGTREDLRVFSFLFSYLDAGPRWLVLVVVKLLTLKFSVPCL